MLFSFSLTFKFPVQHLAPWTCCNCIIVISILVLHTEVLTVFLWLFSDTIPQMHVQLRLLSFHLKCNVKLTKCANRVKNISQHLTQSVSKVKN